MGSIQCTRHGTVRNRGWAVGALLMAISAGFPASRAEAQNAPTTRFGAHFGINPAQLEAREGRLGMQVILPAFRLFEVVPAIGYYVYDQFDGPAWQASVHGRIRPFGPGTTSPFYVGLGASMLRHGGGTVFYDVEVVGLEFDAGRVSLFTEAMLYGLLDEGPTGDDALNVVVGFNVPFSR